MWNALVEGRNQPAAGRLGHAVETPVQPAPPPPRVFEWGLYQLAKKHGVLGGDIAALARPGAEKFEMLDAMASKGGG